MSLVADQCDKAKLRIIWFPCVYKSYVYTTCSLLSVQ